MKHSNHIGIYENALSPEFCQQCIEIFEKSPHKAAGETGQGVDTKKKNSIDITVSNYADEWNEHMQVVSNAVLAGMIDYVRQHPFLLTGAVSLMKQVAPGQFDSISYEDVIAMPDDAIAGYLNMVYRIGSVNMQKYPKGEGGYFHWHSETFPSPHDPHQDSLHRVVLWMFYLNDVTEGGETDFYFQELSSKPKQGTLVIAPAGFTHAHRGNKPISNDKYIFTSWILFKNAGDLYGNQG